MRRFSAGDFARIEGRMGDLDRPVLSLLLVLLTATGAAAEESLRGLQACLIRPAERVSRWNPTSSPSPSRWRRSSRRSSPFCISLRGGRWMRRVSDLEERLAGARAKLERAALTTQGDRQVVICWDRSDSKPALDGDFALVADVPEATHVLDYASWLGDAAAAQVVEASERLLNRGESFSLSAVTRHGRHIEISGRPVSGSAVMRIRDVSGDRLELAELREKAVRTEEAFGALRLAVQSAGILAWRRDAEGRMVWCNETYAEAVEAPDDKAAIDNKIELFEASLRREALEAVRESGVWKRHASAVVNGERRTFDAVEVQDGSWLDWHCAGRFSDHGAARRNGAQRGRLLAHDRSSFDGGRDLRQVETAHFLQRGLPADVVARAGIPGPGPLRRRSPRSSPLQAPIAGAGELP